MTNPEIKPQLQEGESQFAPFWEKQAPDFVNDIGAKWWIDTICTQWATREDGNGVSLDYQVWVVEHPDGHKTRVLLNDARKAIYEHPSLENMATKIDMFKLIKHRGTTHTDK